MKKSSMALGDEWLQKRSAGVLMHITSLSGPDYTGDIGSAAKRFVDFLVKAKQAVWQLLPLNPTTADQSYSPYSSSSAMAANPLLLSPEWLLKRKLIRRTSISDNKAKSQNAKADFQKAEQYKNELLSEAWSRWNEQRATEKSLQRRSFEKFCAKESYWLDDFALYSVIKQRFENAAWYQWPKEFKSREKRSIANFAREDANRNEIEKIKFIQYLFHLQWQELRAFSNERGIRLMGDMPMYVAHDSSDVWSHQEIFTLKSDGTMSEVSGVPPDLFNDNGQLWGTPLFRWDVLKRNGYKWWLSRFKRNFELFDLLRLDHFRAFASYWAVPAKAKNAKSGKWKQGPGTDIFKVAERSLGKLPLIAEDLGEIDQAVYDLRDELALPGMNVLQFGFSDKKLDNDYLPHRHISNSLVYTGTHDNDTTVGWYKSMDKIARNNLSSYLGKKITTDNVSDELCRLAYQSVSKLAVLPMQDILSLDTKSRMNMPATARGNWTWRLDANQLTDAVIDKLKAWVKLYGR